MMLKETWPKLNRKKLIKFLHCTRHSTEGTEHRNSSLVIDW